VDSNSKKDKALTFLQTYTRKACTLLSMLYSAVIVWQDGTDPRLLDHFERLRYLELRSALNYKNNIVVYDIGANRGDFGSFLARLSNVSSVYCFEPLPDVYRDLTKSTRNYNKLKCFQVALGDRFGIAGMHANIFNPSSSILAMDSLHMEEFPQSRNSHEIEVRVMRLDDTVREFKLLPPDFIKIDVQGFEERVINGGREVIRKARFCLLELSLVSLYEKSGLITDINSLMRTLGFSLISIVGKIKGKSGEILQIDGLYRNNLAA
jgi:FkbM family methyltransferase